MKHASTSLHTSDNTELHTASMHATLEYIFYHATKEQHARNPLVMHTLTHENNELYFAIEIYSKGFFQHVIRYEGKFISQRTLTVGFLRPT